MTYLEQKWFAMSDEQLSKWLDTQWDCYMDGQLSDREEAKAAAYKLKDFLKPLGKEWLWNDAFKAGQVRLKAKREREQAARAGV